ncbi:TetR family transcriptional regulator [Parafrankia soli]
MAAEAGSDKAQIYHYFGSKNGLVEVGDSVSRLFRSVG